ncbi:hypothetical protein TX25_28650 [Pseudomonas lactis]|nr:hypothetical protein TX25_28650 [Pseudomonas lactis]
MVLVFIVISIHTLTSFTSLLLTTNYIFCSWGTRIHVNEVEYWFIVLNAEIKLVGFIVPDRFTSRTTHDGTANYVELVHLVLIPKYFFWLKCKNNAILTNLLNLAFNFVDDILVDIS